MQSKLPFLNDAKILDKINRMHCLPVLCGAIDQLWEYISHNESATVEEIASLIRYDQVLVAKVLRLANGSIFGQRNKIITLREGIELIGFENIRSICLSSLLNSLFFDKEKIDVCLREWFWKNSYTTARIASTIVKKRAWISEEQAYTLGLVHDIGTTCVAVFFPELAAFLKDLAKIRKIPLWHVEQQYGFSHTRVGKWLAIKWGFPEVFQNVIAFHHQPEKSTKFKPEVKVISLANILACAEDYPELVWDRVTRSYLNDLYITEQEWEECIRSLDIIQGEAQQIWNMIGQERMGDGAFG